MYLFWTLPVETKLLRFAVTMVLGGAIGNIVDRVRLGEVVDFFDFGIGNQWRWPIFNVADSFVTVGIIILAIGYSRQKEPQTEQPIDSNFIDEKKNIES